MYNVKNTMLSLRILNKILKNDFLKKYIYIYIVLICTY